MPETMFIRGEGGSVFEMGLPLHEAIAERLHKGHLVRVNPDGSTYTEADERTPPAVTDRKTEWVSWAVHNGATPDDAEALTKTDLIEKYGL
ncbi:hypothetical protein [Arthrobacter russicus]|uniref:Uncharacterized protein n=1 Tax=Arthrobacter russicus TaxID=172040 RepID=A0ABU1J913_9MICC|nr:hypothetical protein [Arthrobacter russicus]MDR6268914.1 hypothetical protein [Arthrobacter russicus]